MVPTYAVRRQKLCTYTLDGLFSPPVSGTNMLFSHFSVSNVASIAKIMPPKEWNLHICAMYDTDQGNRRGQTCDRDGTRLQLF